eukprot:398463_1
MHDSDKLNYETLHLIPNKKKNTKITHEIKYKMSSKIKHGHGKANQDYDDEYDDQYDDDDEYDNEYDDEYDDQYYDQDEQMSAAQYEEDNYYDDEYDNYDDID